MIVGIILFILCVVLWMIFRNEQRELFQKLPKKGNELKIFYPVAYAIMRILAQRQILLSRKQRKTNIEALNVLKEEKDSEILFNVRRIAMCYAIVFATSVLVVLYELANSGGGILQGNSIARPGYGQTVETQELVANENLISFEISPREYSAKEVQDNFVKAHDELLQIIKGENEALNTVRTKLNLVTYLEKYAMKVTWLSSDSETVSIYGDVNNYEFEQDETREVTLTAILSYLDYTCNDEIVITVCEPQLDEKEEFIRSLIKEIKKQDETTRQEKTLVLPEKIGEQRISYTEQKESNFLVLLLLGVLTAVVVFPGMDKDLEGKMKERRMEMQMDYSEIVSKLNILMGSGMSVQKAWEKIIRDYEKHLLSGEKKKRYAYEEMKKTYYEIQSGISESRAYAEFGRRCNIHEYLKLGALLEQNVKKGAKGLKSMLEKEVEEAFEQRKNLARKLGEEAGTKMLIPMILMLSIVMIIVLVPAFSSFNL